MGGKAWFKSFNLDSLETYVSARLRSFIIAALALLILTGLVGLLVFFVAVRGAEQILVPDVVGKELTTALIELQAKELYPRLQLRYSQNADDKGQILEQDPQSGAIVKAGRRIRLVVSRGLMLDTVEDFIGQNIDDVKAHLQTLFSTSAKPLLSLADPPIYDYSNQPAGTILQQKPLAGSPLSGPTLVELVVSRGLENPLFKVPDVIGLPYMDAVERMKQAGVGFVFSMRPASGDDKPETVVAQDPAGQSVIDATVRVSLEVAMPKTLEANSTFGIFSADLPDYPYPLALRLDAILPSGEHQLLFTTDHPGGYFAIPYSLPRASILTLSVLNRVVKRDELP